MKSGSPAKKRATADTVIGRAKAGTRGLYRDCIDRVLNGDPVKDVHPAAEKIVACKEWKETQPFPAPPSKAKPAVR